VADPAGLTLVALGTAGAYRTHEGSRASGYLVRRGADAVALDLGHGAYAPLAASLGIAGLPRVGAVAISHLHPDHWVDLAALRHALVHGNGMGQPGDGRRMRVIGPAGLAERLAAILDVRSPEEQAGAAPAPTPQPFDFGTWRDGATHVGGLELRPAPVRHAGESYALRVAAAGAPGLVYSGDLSHWEDLLPLISPGDVLLCEAALGDAPWDEGSTHVGAEGAARAARAGGASALLLTHLGAEVDPDAAAAAAARNYTGPIRVLREGDELGL